MSRTGETERTPESRLTSGNLASVNRDGDRVARRADPPEFDGAQCLQFGHYRLLLLLNRLRRTAPEATGGSVNKTQTSILSPLCAVAVSTDTTAPIASFRNISFIKQIAYDFRIG